MTLQELHQFNNLEIIARQVVEGFIIGLHKSPFHGFSVEFAEHRLYNSGDSLRNVDWKVYARTDRMYVKRYEEETNLRCQVVIDASSSMYFPENTPNNKLRFSCVAAASLMNILKKQRDAVGLSVFSENVDYHTIARSTSIHHNLLLSTLQQYLDAPSKHKKTNAADCLHQIAENVHKRSMVLIFSDMFESNEDNDELFAALQHLKYNKHEVILFHVFDKKLEADFDFENRPYEFIDMETGESVKIQAAQVKSYYRQQVHKAFKELHLRCTQYKIDLVTADINQDFTQVLLPYLAKRIKMMA
ncbi:MAG: DUF58 domain-containing protein [Bacteroidetes bacterium]|nr:DUF58 domain-containing protein [Bacteroidota bacterium]MCB9043093.1 DUF58 domain-containing protein [Chitinophagales bacterium]